MNKFLRYKDIIYYRTLAGLKSEARKNYLGYIWFILEPLLGTGAFYIAMTHITGHKGTNAVLSILIGMTVWQWFEGSIMISANSLIAKFHIHLQVPLPKYVFPLVDVSMHTVRFAFAFSLIAVACLMMSAAPSMQLLWLLPVLVIQFVFTLSIALGISVLVTLFPDLLLLLQSIFRLLFFLSGIFFSASSVPEHLLPYFFANPIAVFLESYREIILYQRPPHWNLLCNTVVIALVSFTISLLIQRYYDKRLLKLTNA